MPAYKVSELSIASAMNDTDTLYIIHNSLDAQITGAALKSSIIGPGAITVVSGKTLTVSDSMVSAGQNFANMFTSFPQTVSAVTSGGVALSITQSADATYQYFLRGVTTDAGAADFNFILDSTPFFNGTRDHTLFWGYNVGSQGVVVAAGDANAFWALESNYNDGARHQVECYFSLTSTIGVGRRLFTINTDRDNPDVYSLTTILISPTNGKFVIANTNAPGTSIFEVGSNGTISLIGTGNGISFQSANPSITNSSTGPILLQAGGLQTYLSENVNGWEFGAARDTNIYRSAANTLSTDDTFVAPTIKGTTVLVNGATATGAALVLGASDGKGTIQIPAASAAPTLGTSLGGLRMFTGWGYNYITSYASDDTTPQILFITAASLSPQVSATYDIGSSTYKWRAGYFSGALLVGGDLTHSGANAGFFNHAVAVQPTTASFGAWTTLANVVAALQSIGVLGV